jgi:hypothetical protein
MQQVHGAAGVGSSQGGNSLPQGGTDERFVINLSASTTPVALVPPAQPELRRFSFFVTRKLESGRERFRLHMGYFDSQEEAERMLEIVREVYPAAWAGAAPGQRLRTRAPGAAAPAPVHVAAPAALPIPPVEALARIPEVAAAPAAVEAAPAPTVIPFPGTRTSAEVAQAAVPPGPDVIAAVPVAEPVAAPRINDADEAAQTLGQIRATLDALAAPPLSAPEALALLESPPRMLPAADTAVQPALARVPQSKPQPKAPAPAAPVAPEVPVYAVQLLWSVQPIDMGKVPRLAIFSAYRLYGAEGNRDGRRWYGLRLGFFNDPASARQVAQYVRSEFNSVSVVPVTQRERERASGTAPRPLPSSKGDQERSHGLQFIDEVPTDTATSGSNPALAHETADQAEMAWAEAARRAVKLDAKPHAPTGKRVKVRVGNKPAAKHKGTGQRRPPETLEQTLEALGASTLSMHEDRGERLVLDSRGGPAKPAPGNSRFGKLLDNLARRFGTP